MVNLSSTRTLRSLSTEERLHYKTNECNFKVKKKIKIKGKNEIEKKRKKQDKC